MRLVRRRITAPRIPVRGAEVRALFAAEDAGPVRPGWRPWQVLGGPGTGKTTLLVEYAAERIAAGVDPGSVLVVTYSKEAANTLRDSVTARLRPDGADEGGVPGASREPLARTLHSYAFGILRSHATRHGNPPPRLLTGAEQDAVVRELLQGDLLDMAAGARLWPQRLQPALGLAGFADQLRDLMLRATERGLGPEDLVRLGREHDREEWVAAGRFARRFEESLLLRWSVGVEAPEASAPALDAAELVGAALDALAADPELLAAERERIRYLLVDDAQHLDPQAALLVRVIGTGSATTVLAGDPDQAVFTFRGADPAFIADPGAPADRRILLRRNHRTDGPIELAVARIAGRLPGNPPHRVVESALPAVRDAPGYRDHPEGADTIGPVSAAAGGPSGAPERASGRPAPGGDRADDGPIRAEEPDDAPPAEVRVRVLSTPAKEAALVADHLRRAHLSDGVPWSRMAVILRSVPASLAPLRRALLAAGVPVHQPAPDVPLARRRGAAWLLLAVRALLAGDETRRGPDGSTAQLFEPEDALDLLAGPLGGADQIALRRLRRGIRRAALDREPDPDDRSSAEALRDIIVGTGDSALPARLTEVESAPLRRTLSALQRGRAARRRGGAVEDVLWALWTGSRLERRWVAQSERGGAVGMQADRDLDAVVGLFDAAAAYVDRLPRASLEGFVEYVRQQEIPQEFSAPAAPGDAVELLSAHAAAGREWDVVAVAAVQEGLWPNPRPRGTLLHTEDLVDLYGGVSGAGERVSRAAPILAEERRLLLVACSRARRSLLVTAVESVTGDRDLVPSRFLTELLGHSDDGEPGVLPVADPGRALVLHALVAELRGVVCDPEADGERRDRAAHQLARLAAAGVRGTHPDEWYGTGAPSTAEPLWADDGTPVNLSPSTVELLRTCPLRWALERNGGSDGENPYALKGNLVHTLVQALAGEVSEERVREALYEAWANVEPGNGWHSRQELRRTEGMLENFLAWFRATRAELTQAGVEIAVDCLLPARGEGEPPVRIRGRVDRLERDADGRFVIVDVKTGKSPVTRQAAADHAQLATYQVAVAAGAIDAALAAAAAADSPDAGAPTPGDPGEAAPGGGDVSGGEAAPGGGASMGADAGPEPAAGAATEPQAPGGARLVYVAVPNTKQGAAERAQPPLADEALDGWRDTVHDAAGATKGPGFRAVRNEGCRHCPVTGCCPTRDTGRQVTDE
ncbi:ATP-dependent helicase [Nocardia sp. NPDC057227]|uniref:ATP-dependent helicase n=1 Tax=Nocardia sp. NPDC057227 TaxID=3346056 RepID=UPI00363A9096